MGESITPEQCKATMEPLRDMLGTLFNKMDERDEKMHARDRERDERLTQIRLDVSKRATEADVTLIKMAIGKAAPQAEVEAVKLAVAAANESAIQAKKSIGKWWAFLGAVTLVLIAAALAAWPKGGAQKVIVLSKAELEKIVGGQ